MRHGRPPLPLDQARSEIIRVRVTPAEVDALYRAARRHDLPLAEMVRIGCRVAVTLDPDTPKGPSR